MAKTNEDSNMKTAKDLMLGYIAGTAEQSGALFADNGTLELPYLASIGLPPVLKGPEEMARGDNKVSQLSPRHALSGVFFRGSKDSHRHAGSSLRRVSHQSQVRDLG
jgi:hypothetical protein